MIGAGFSAAVLRRIIAFLVSRGLFLALEDGRFALTESGQLLRSDHNWSVRQRAIFNTELLFPLWGELLYTVTTGESAAIRVFGTHLYEYLAEHPDVRGVLRPHDGERRPLATYSCRGGIRLLAFQHDHRSSSRWASN